MPIPIQHRAKCVAGGVWVLLEPNEEERTEGVVRAGE